VTTAASSDDVLLNNWMDWFTPALTSAWDYWLDAAQRSVLFWDTLRQRGNIYLEHSRKGKPPVLLFDYEMIVDGRTLPRPCNYMLLKILHGSEFRIDPAKRPYVIIDPRAGHGPGIGGFKPDSQVGVAMRAGHPVYFIGFFPNPVPGQSLLDVAQTEAIFIQEVANRHPEADKPCVIGNCQAGWAMAALAAVRPELLGPIVLSGAPLSYWAGSDKQNPMRYAGATLGGSWVASFAADLGKGTFDGVHLVANFEHLNPANTLWGKLYHLYSHVDTEAPRFLEFEKWWGGFFEMTTEEIELIVNELFIGNQLARPNGSEFEERSVNLANIESPVVIFASFGDNITPPQQALNWIIDVYGHEDAIIEAGRVIVYLLHENIGHLGIFVSGKVAKKEHQELVNTMDMIDRLPPGLYEMVIEKRPRNPKDGKKPDQGEYTVRFELRTMDDIRSIDEEGQRRDEPLFSTAARVSELNRGGYDAFWRPWVRSANSETVARWVRETNPMRLERVWWSDLNPMMSLVGTWAELVRGNRRPAPKDNYLLGFERRTSEHIMKFLDAYRDIRDAMNIQFVKNAYGPFGWGAWFPPEPSAEEQARIQAENRLEQRKQELTSKFESGGKVEGLVRILMAMISAEGGIESRSFLIGERLGRPLEKWVLQQKPNLTQEEWRKILGEQTILLKMDRDRAIQALPKLIWYKKDRREIARVVATLMMREQELFNPDSPLARRCREVLGVDFTQPVDEEEEEKDRHNRK
jgi:hypothetical protein